MRPNAELAFRELAESEGWDVTKRGWPDFFCRRNGELMAVEVKDGHDGLSAQQYETICDLRRAGIPTFVWAPTEGFTEVGPPVGESVFSLKATIAELRAYIASKERPTPLQLEPANVVQWTFIENDPESIRALKNECLRSHGGHNQEWRRLGTSGAWCADLVVLAQQYSADQIVDMLAMPNVGRMRGHIERCRRYLFTYQHDRLHASIGVGRLCTGCAQAA